MVCGDAMRRVLPLFVPLLVLAGCGGGGFESSAPPASPGASATLRAGFPKGGLADTIAIEAVERLPLREAVLLAPDGTATPSGAIDVDASPSFTAGQQVAGDPWQNALTGRGSAAAPNLLHAEAGAAVQSREQLLATVSRADIALPDPAVYRRDWAHYKIRLIFGTPPGEVQVREIPAPRPPPAG